MKTVGRVKDGVAMEAAEAEATRLVVNGRRAEGMTDRVRVLFGSIIAARRPDASAESGLTLWLVGVSVIVLLIACANVANLLTARSTTQRKEIAVRMALGAGRKRVIGQTMVESILLALAGGVLALVLARWGGEIIRSTLLPDVYFPSSAITLRLFGFTTIVALIAGAVAGVVPAIQSSRTDLTEDLSETSLGNSGGRSNLHLFLTNAQAAMSVILLVGAGLFVRSVGEVRSIDLGLDVDRLLQARLEFGAARLADSEWNGLYREAALRVAALPVVRSAAATNAPMGLASQGPLEVPGLDSIPSLPGGGPYWRNVTAGYFETAGVAILRGRPIEESEFDRVAVVSETMASTLWPGRDGLGECLLLNREQDCTTVVGVAEDAARDGFQDAPFMAFYTPVPEDDGSLLAALYVRTEGDAEAALGDVSLLLRSFSPQVRNARVQTVEELLDPQVRQWRIGAVLFSLFGLLAMCLAAIGLYAVLAFDVARRRRELGIRAALGAGTGRLLGGVFVRGGQLTLFGVVLGLGVAYLIAPYARDLLFEVSPRDPGVLTGVALLLVVVTLVGSLLPGVRATRVNPTVSLKSE
jgi:predicted permease